MRPPFDISAKMLETLVLIERLLGRYEGMMATIPEPKLRKQNRIRSVHGSLVIEGNSLTEDQMTALLEGKRVVGPKNEILEVQNAIEAYRQLLKFNPLKSTDLLRAHSLFLKGLLKTPGQWRRGGVGVLKGSRVSHLAPPAKRVPDLMNNLFEFLKTSKDHPLIKASVFHYELEFIHPFEDGNGRMGRFWQSLLMVKFHRLFEFVPFESVIRDQQTKYYQTLELSDQAGNSTLFIEFILATILQALQSFIEELKPKPLDQDTRIEMAHEHFGKRDFDRFDYLQFFKTISTATASRDLAHGVRRKLLVRRGEKALTKYRYRS